MPFEIAQASFRKISDGGQLAQDLKPPSFHSALP